MILKLAVISVLFGVCFTLPVEESKVVEAPPTHGLVPLEPKPGKFEDLPKPPKTDDSDLKTDASTWWHTWHYHEVPVYYYPTYHVPVNYVYWKNHH